MSGHFSCQTTHAIKPSDCRGCGCVGACRCPVVEARRILANGPQPVVAVLDEPEEDYRTVINIDDCDLGDL